jgi:diacylglycerol kinase
MPSNKSDRPRPTFRLACAAILSAINILIFVQVAGLRTQLHDGPFVMVKEVTNPNLEDVVSKTLNAYHRAQFREKDLQLAAVLSCALSATVLILSLSALVGRRTGAG